MKRILFCTSLLAGLAFCSPARAAVDQKKVDEAIQRGMDLLWSEQQEDGSWKWSTSEPRKLGITSLVALALYENGVLPSDPRLRKALNYVRTNAPRNKDAYSVSLATVLLARVGQRQDRTLVRTLAAKLADGQHLTGGWHYGIPETPGDTGFASTNMGDLSVSQFAVLALWQAQRIGAPVRGAFERIRQRLAWAQTPNGGWGYHGLPDMADSPTMTTAGTFMWIVSSAYEIKEARRKNEEKVVPREPRRRPEFDPEKLLADATKDNASDKDVDKKIKEALKDRPVDLYAAVERGAFDRKRQQNKADNNVKFEEGTEPGQLFYKYEDKLPPVLEVTKPSPLVEDKPLQDALKRVAYFAERSIKGTGNYYYYLWSIERLGVLLGMESFGNANWFELGAESLLRRQNENGSWGTKLEDEKEPYADQYLADTAFSILFLKKANLGSDVARLLHPDPENPFTIENGESRYKTLAEAVKAAQAEDVIVVQGDGPFPVAGFVIDKPISIRAAQGYDPVFRYELPKDELGFDLELTDESPERNMFIIKADKVTLEGLRIQMDPPSRTRDVNWVAIRCEGTSISMLNCTLSESERRGTTGLLLSDSPRVFIRNSMFNGFNPSIDVNTKTQCNIMVRDSVLYGPECFRVAGEGAFNFWFLESTAHTNKFLNEADLRGSSYVIAENNVIRAEELIANIGTQQASRAWMGRYNLYDVRLWVAGGAGAAKDSIRDLDSWRKYWKTEELRSRFAKAPFEVPRLQLGPFRHDLSPQEWGLQDDAMRTIMVMSAKDEEQIGANVLFVGAGLGYLQFREKLDYENWLSATLPSQRASNSTEQ